MTPASDIDRLLLSFCETRWLKVARIIGETYDALEARGFKIFRGIAKLMDARMAILVRSGKVEAKGNIKRWGNSEVRLPPGQTHRFLKPVLARGGADHRKKTRAEAAE